MSKVIAFNAALTAVGALLTMLSGNTTATLFAVSATLGWLVAYNHN